MVRVAAEAKLTRIYKDPQIYLSYFSNYFSCIIVPRQVIHGWCFLEEDMIIDMRYFSQKVMDGEE